jgi:hypothetical protein
LSYRRGNAPFGSYFFLQRVVRRAAVALVELALGKIRIRVQRLDAAELVDLLLDQRLK